VTCLPFHGIHGQTCTGLHWNPVHEALRISSILGPHLEDLEILMYDLGPGFPGLVWQTEIESTCSISIPLSICSDRTGVHCIHVYVRTRTAAIDPTVRLASSRRRSHHQPCRATSRYSLRS
jgi:hypothetical protein